MMSASQEWVIQLQNASLSASLNHSTSGASLNPDSLRNSRNLDSGCLLGSVVGATSARESGLQDWAEGDIDAFVTEA